jgi:hypothetical protein
MARRAVRTSQTLQRGSNLHGLTAENLLLLASHMFVHDTSSSKTPTRVWGVALALHRLSILSPHSHLLWSGRAAPEENSHD